MLAKPSVGRPEFKLDGDQGPCDADNWKMIWWGWGEHFWRRKLEIEVDLRHVRMVY